MSILSRSLGQEGDNPEVTQLRSLADLKTLWDLLAWYALVSKVVRAQSLRRLLRPLLITVGGTAFAGVAVWSVAGTVAMGSSFASGSNRFLPKPQFYSVESMQARLSGEHANTGKAPRLLAATAQPVVAASFAAGRGKSARHPDVSAAAATSGNAARFDAVVKQAGLTPEKLASLFDRSSSAKSHRPTAKVVAPAPERFASLPAASTDQPLTLLAYADPSPRGAADAALSALLAAPLEEDLAASEDPNLEIDEDAAALPDYEDTPSGGPLPQPRGDQARKPVPETEKPDVQRVEKPAVPKADEPRKADERETPKPQKLAYARPNDPAERKSGSFGQSLRNMFGGGARAGNGVAVYDISAARVYMPDGSVLEAHSGIGKMADNPRYAHIKMNGPTPPHTYNLKMRERRFHGVEAIRMLPVDGRNKHGRDGFLTHSYLLRGGRAESHGCVAFKDYSRFLTAFKQGKVRQLVVVPSGGRASMRVASNGKSRI